MQTKKNGSAAASGRKVEKNAGAKAAGTGKAGTGKAETPEAAKAPAVQPPAPVKCSPAAAKASNDAIKAAAAKIEAEKAGAVKPQKTTVDEWRALAYPLDEYAKAKAKERKAKHAAAVAAAASASPSILAVALVQCVTVKVKNGGNHAAADTFLSVLTPEAEKRGIVFGTPDKVQPEKGATVAIIGEKANYHGRVDGIGPKNVRIITNDGAALTFARETVAAVAKVKPPAEKPASKPPAEKPEEEKPAPRNPFDYSADIEGWRKIAKTNPHEARADIATWASLLPVPDDSNLVFVTCLDTFASVAYLLEKAGRRIVSLEKMSDDAARTFKAELAKVVDAKAAAELAACL